MKETPLIWGVSSFSERNFSSAPSQENDPMTPLYLPDDACALSKFWVDVGWEEYTIV